MKYILIIILISSQLVIAQSGFYSMLQNCGSSYGANVHHLSSDEYLLIGNSITNNCITFLRLDSVGSHISIDEFSYGLPGSLNLRLEISILDKNGHLVLIAQKSAVLDSLKSQFENVHLMKFDLATMDTIWTKTILTPQRDIPYSIKETQEGYKVLYQSQFPFYKDGDLLNDKTQMAIANFDYNGNLLEDKRIKDLMRFNLPKSFELLESGNTLVSFDSRDDCCDDLNYIALLDSNYQFIWTQRLQDRHWISRPSLAYSPIDSTVFGSSYKIEYDLPGISGSGSGKIFAFNLDGSEIWQKSLVSINNGYTIDQLTYLNNGQIVCAGYVNPDGMDIKASYGRMSLLNSDGTIVWDNIYRLKSEPFSDISFNNIIETNDRSIFTIGDISRSNAEIFGLKVDRATGCIDPNCEELVIPAPRIGVSSSNETISLFNFQVFPNPSNGEFQIIAKDGSSSFQVNIFDVNKKLIYQNTNAKNKETLNLPEHTKGIHFLKLIDEEGNVFIEKVFLE